MSVGHIVFFVVAAAAPLTVVGSLFSVIVGIGNGAGIAGAFFLVSVVLLVFAVGYTAMSRHIVDAGDFYAFVSVGLGRPPGLGAAGLAIFAYTAIQLGVIGAFGYYASAFVDRQLGVSLPWWAWSFVAIAGCLFLGVRRIDLGAKIMGVLLIAETISIVVVDIAIVSHGLNTGHDFTLDPLSPSTTFSGALGVAVMFCHASFIGFEGTAIYGEESKDPKTAVPRATYIAVAFMGVFYTLTAWLVINAFDAGGAVAAARQDPEGFFFNIGDNMVGNGTGTVLSLLIITSLFAAICAFHNNVARYFFALGRQRVLWHRLGETHTTRQSPTLACALQAAIAFVVVAGFAVAGRDPFVDLFTWMTGIGAVGIILVQSLAGLAIIAFFRRRPDLDSRVWNTLIAPILGFVGLMTLLFFAFKNIDTLVGASTGVKSGLLIFLFGSFTVGLVAALRWRATDHDQYLRLGAQLQEQFVSQPHREVAAPVVTKRNTPAV
jgi:amino acid transporter